MQKICVVCLEKFFTAYDTQEVCGNICRRVLKLSRRKINKMNKPRNRPKAMGNIQKVKKLQIKAKGYCWCIRCKITGISAMFQTHHIVYRSEKPYHPELHNILNLIVLCADCHKRYHDKKDRREGLVEERGLDILFDM